MQQSREEMVKHSNIHFSFSFSSIIVSRFVKPVMEEKDSSWRDAAAELTLTVIIDES